MRHFDLLILVNSPQQDVYNHLADPHNLLGLQPLLTSVEVLEESRNENNAIVRPFYSIETFRFLGIPIYNNRIKVISTLTKPPEKMEYFVESQPGIHIRFTYQLKQENGSTQINLHVGILQVNTLLESFVYKEAIKTQREVLVNLKKRLEGLA